MFLNGFFFMFKIFFVYCRGLVLESKRKSVERLNGEID